MEHNCKDNQHTHVQLHQETDQVKEALKPKSVSKKKPSIMSTEEDSEMEETLSDNTSCIASLDTGSTFNLTNNENTLTKTVKVESPIA